VFRALTDLVTEYNETEVDFDTFIKDLTERLVMIMKYSQGSPFNEAARRKIWELLDFEAKEVLTPEDIRFISNELKFNLTEDDIKEVIQNVAGYEADSIPYDKFEKYMARKIHKRQLEQEVLKG